MGKSRGAATITKDLTRVAMSSCPSFGSCRNVSRTFIDIQAVQRRGCSSHMNAVKSSCKFLIRVVESIKRLKTSFEKARVQESACAE